MIKTLWRELLYAELAKHALVGTTLDVGGDRASQYHELMCERPLDIRVANFESKTKNDISCDLEKGIPVGDDLFDTVLCINVLEHVFNYQQLLAEMHRVMRKEGRLIIAVPFIIAYHPSPRDHWRFTSETLTNIVTEAGFRDVEIQTIGTGVFGALYQLSHGFLHFNSLRVCARYFAIFLDRLVSRFKKHNVYDKTHYPLGYVVIATK